jgi:putative hemolysin
MSDVLRILIVLSLVGGNAMFVAAEYALVAARRTRLSARAESGSRAAALALRLMDEPVRFISTVQIAITMLGIALGAVGEPLVSRYLDWLPEGVAYVVAFVVLTYLGVALGELAPKAVALQKAEAYAVLCAYPLWILQCVAAPLVWLLQATATAVIRPFGIETRPVGELVRSEADIRELVAGAEEAGVIAESEEEMLYKVFDFADKEVAQIMIPRPQVVALQLDTLTPNDLEAALDSPFTRVPVFRHGDEVAGILHVRDVFAEIRRGRSIEELEIEPILRPALAVPETKDLAALLADFRRGRQHLAVVLDEYGSTVGIATLEDLLEEIVGEIEDEFDLPDESLERVDALHIRIGGTFPVDDLNEQLGVELPKDAFRTVGGLVFGRLGRAPRVGDEVEVADVRLRVLAVERSRVARLELELPRAATPS